MKIETFVTGIIGTNTYVAYNETTKEAVLVDPAACTKKLMHFIEEEGLSMKAVLLTHGHFDHIMGIDGFCKVYDVPVYVGEKEAGLITDAHWNQSDIYTKGYTFSEAVYVQDGKILRLAGYDFQVFFTPGHTPGGVCYYVVSADRAGLLRSKVAVITLLEIYTNLISSFHFESVKSFLNAAKWWTR